MATVDNEVMEQFTAADALRLVSGYFDKEWPQTELKDVKLRKVTGGFVNRLHLITRTNKAEMEPNSILIRHFGLGVKTFHEEPFASSTTLSSTEQALIYREMGQKGWGPKLYGVFAGGRLEEYLDAHPLTATEASDPSIRRDLARSFARLHSLQLPFRKGNFQMLVEELKRNANAKNDRTVQRLSDFGHSEAAQFAGFLRDMDWNNELDWAASLFRKHHCKVTIALGDTNFLNALVKKYGQDCRAVLIDYETCTYSYRGVDIGGHFNERMYCWSHPESTLTGYDAPDSDEQRAFCRSYLQEMQQLGLDMTAEDTEEHLMLEAQIGRMWQILFSVAMCFAADELPDMPPMLAGLAHMIATYWRLKSEWKDLNM